MNIAIKKILSTFILLLCITSISYAQPSAVKKAAKGVFKLMTFKSDGTLLANGYGVFTNEDGTGLAAWTPFEGAHSAIVIDYEGNKYDVDCLYGANAFYNVAKLKIKKDEKRKIQTVPIEPGQTGIGNDTWCIEYGVKKAEYHQFKINKVEQFMGNLPYYIIEQDKNTIGEQQTGAPFFNAEGQLMGLFYTSTTRTDLYIASARYAIALEPSALSANDNTLRKTNVRIALPKEYNQAILALLIAEQKNDTDSKLATIEEFIKLFPDKEDGYISKAKLLTEQKKIEEAEEYINKALNISEHKDNIHYVFSQIIYNTKMTMPAEDVPQWTLDKAISETDEAYSISPLPVYLVMKGRIMFTQEKYKDAYAIFEKAIEIQSDPEVYYYEYQCLKNMDEEKTLQLEKLDSAINIAPDQVIYKAEKMLLLMKMKNAEEAVAIGKKITEDYPMYAEGRGLYGLALCLNGNRIEGIKELQKAKEMGYSQADGFLAKYGK